MPRVKCRRLAGIGVLLILAAVATAYAEVYVTAPTVGRILVLNSSGALIRSIGEAGGWGSRTPSSLIPSATCW